MVEQAARRIEEYGMPRPEASELTAGLLAERPPKTDDRFVYYQLMHDDPYAAVGRQVEGEVFHEVFRNTPEQMEAEYGIYEPQGRFIVAIDREGVGNRPHPAGVIRAIGPGKAGFKTLNDLDELHRRGEIDLSKQEMIDYHGIDVGHCWDIGTMAAPEEYRGNVMGMIMAERAIYLAAVEAKVDHVIAIMDTKPFDKLKNYLGFPFAPLGGLESFPYLDSPDSLPIYGYLPEFYDAVRLRWSNPKSVLRWAVGHKALRTLVFGEHDTAIQFETHDPHRKKH